MAKRASVLILACWAASGCGFGAASAPHPASKNECELAAGPQFCLHKESFACRSATAACVAGTPNTLGPCICDAAALQKIGPRTAGTTEIESGTVGGGRVYWSEYLVDFSGTTTVIVGGPLVWDGVGFRELARVHGRVDLLRATADALYALTPNGPLAFSPDGAALPTPTPSEAFPPDNSRVTQPADGTYVDGVKISPIHYSVVETADGFYFVAEPGSSSIAYVPFANLDLSKAKDAVSGGGMRILRIWGAGTTLFAATDNPDAVTPPVDKVSVNIIDLSLIGR